jgi:hypothetical protein
VVAFSSFRASGRNQRSELEVESRPGSGKEQINGDEEIDVGNREHY